MPLINLAGMTTATTGAGTITLGSAMTGLRTLAAAGAVIRWWVGIDRLATGERVVLKKDTDSGIIISGSVATVAIAPTDTKALTPATYYHEAKVFFADGTESTVTVGSFVLTPTIVR